MRTPNATKNKKEYRETEGTEEGEDEKSRYKEVSRHDKSKKTEKIKLLDAIAHVNNLHQPFN